MVGCGWQASFCVKLDFVLGIEPQRGDRQRIASSVYAYVFGFKQCLGDYPQLPLGFRGHFSLFIDPLSSYLFEAERACVNRGFRAFFVKVMGNGAPKQICHGLRLDEVVPSNYA